jgi:hypothetical protein
MEMFVPRVSAQPWLKQKKKKSSAVEIQELRMRCQIMTRLCFVKICLENRPKRRKWSFSLRHLGLAQRLEIYG